MTMYSPEQQQYYAQQPELAAQQPENGEPAYPAYPGTAQPVPARTTVAELNAYALVSVITTFIMPLVGIIFGHLALGQIKRTGDPGRGLALTGLIYGYCVFALTAVVIITYLGIIFMIVGSFASAGYAYSS